MSSPSSHNGGVLRRSDLLAAGMKPKAITRAVRDGQIIRLRRDRYVLASGGATDTAVRIGGRLGCVSLLALHQVFVFDASVPHVHLEHSMSRMRAPDGSRRSWTKSDRGRARLHWWALRSDDGCLGTVGLRDALAQAIRCQTPRLAVATVDSVLHRGLLSPAEVREVFSWLAPRYGAILRLVNPSAESGTESLVRLMLRQLGLSYETQTSIPGVGRVDFLVEGWLVVECDSRQFHGGWRDQLRDRRRDLAAASLGYTTLRLLAEDILYDQEAVLAALRGVTAGRRR